MSKQVQFIFGSQVTGDGTPAVFIQFGEEKGTVGVDAAAAFALGILTSANKAVQESRVLAWLREKFAGKVPDEEITKLFQEFAAFQPATATNPPAAPPVEETPEQAILRALGEIRAEVGPGTV